jgi:hypothetical protein
LHRKIVEVVSTQVRQQHATTIHLEARRPQQQIVQPGDRIVVPLARISKRGHPCA